MTIICCNLLVFLCLFVSVRIAPLVVVFLDVVNLIEFTNLILQFTKFPTSDEDVAEIKCDVLEKL